MEVDTSRCRRDSCKRQSFTELEGYAYTGKYLVYHVPWPYKNCERLCRQYLECYNFIMEWIDDRHLIGYCRLISGDLMSSKLVKVDMQTSSVYCEYVYLYVILPYKAVNIIIL